MCGAMRTKYEGLRAGNKGYFILLLRSRDQRLDAFRGKSLRNREQEGDGRKKDA